MKEYSRNPAQNARKLFNLHHASLLNAIEQAFGVLKKSFPIIGRLMESNYGLETQKEIIFSCYVLYNYLVGVDPNDAILA